jgi:very-short-patch-repair endonuclease
VREGEERFRKFAKQLRKELTDAETILWSFLRRARKQGFHFRKQHPIGPFIADFACARPMLTVEVDGATHGSDDEVAYDKRRTAYLKAHGWHEIRVTNHDIYRNLDNVLEFIWEEVAKRQPLPPSLRDGPPPPHAGEETGARDFRPRLRGRGRAERGGEGK